MAKGARPKCPVHKEIVMNKATTKAADAAKRAISRAAIPLGLDFEKNICELAGQNVNQAELKREIDAALAAKVQELSNRLLSTFRVTLGL
jgi:23S rRNA G2445 N2-methylase RlmL